MDNALLLNYIRTEYPQLAEKSLQDEIASVGKVVTFKNGDIILFNRQPTLHRGSMLAKRIIVRGNKTFRFNLASTKSFNADYDGDLM